MRVLIFMALLGLFSIAHAQDYRGEITEHVVKPCIVQSMDVDELSFRWGLSVDETLTFLLLQVEGRMDEVYDAVLPLVEDLDEDSRLMLYELHAKMCVDVIRGNT